VHEVYAITSSHCIELIIVDIRNGSDDDLPSTDIVNTASTPAVSMEATLVSLLRKLVEKRREGQRPEELSVSFVLSSQCCLNS